MSSDRLKAQEGDAGQGVSCSAGATLVSPWFVVEGRGRRRRRPYGRQAPLILVLIALVACQPGDRYASPVSSAELRTIGTMELPVAREIATTQATTQATTMPATAPTTAAAEVRLAISECRALCLENNLDLRVQLLSPSIARTQISEEEARFEALFTFDAALAKTDSPMALSATRIGGVSADDRSIASGVRVPLKTGGSIDVSAPLDRVSGGGALDPAYSSAVQASISHPLLRNAGVDVTTHAIRIARYQYQASEARTKLEVIRVLAAVDRVYWRLYAARQDLGVRRQQYELAVALLERSRRLVRAGQVAEVEIVHAESGVADRVERVIVAETALRDRQRDLKRILNQPALPLESDTTIVPATDPNPVRYAVDRAKLLDAALKNRAEMLELELRLAQDSSNVAFAQNQLLPLVTVAYTYRISGLGPTPADAYDLLFRKDFENHSLGLHAEVPIGNEAARSRLRRSLLARWQDLATRQQQAAAIRQEVAGAIDQLETNWQRILAGRQRVVLAARVLEAEQRQFEQGLRTSTDVLDAQTRLADAQSAEIAALADYQIAQVDLAFATGTVLGAGRVD